MKLPSASRATVAALTIVMIAAPCAQIAGRFLAQMPGASRFLFFVSRGGCEAAEERLFEVDADKVVSDIESYLEETKRHVGQNKLRDARQVLDLVEQKLELHRKVLGRQDRDAFSSQVTELRRAVEDRIDSLVRANLRILKEEGSNAAIEYRRTLASMSGISEAELAPVDEAIMSYQPVEQLQHEERMRKKAEKALDQGTAAREIEDEEVRALAKRLEQAREDSLVAAQMREDSIRAVQEEKLRRLKQREESIATANETAAKIDKLLDDGDPEEANTIYDIYEANLKRYLEQTRFDVLRNRVRTLYAEFQQKLSQASQEGEKILILVEQGKAVEAKKTFDAERALLAKYLDAQAFGAIEKSVNALHEDYTVNRAEMQSTAAKIGEHLDEGDTERAYRVFHKHSVQLGRYLDGQVFAELKARVENAYATMQDKKKWAALFVRELEDLIKQKQGAEAFAQFQKSRADLEKFLEASQYSSVKAAVGAANEEFGKNRAKAQKLAVHIKTLLGQKQVEQAYGAFKKQKDSLRHYLADEKAFEELRLSVYDAYREWQEKTRWAAQYSQSIHSLVGQNEGAAAYARFQSGKADLKQYLAPSAYDSLGREVVKAKADYTRGQDNANATASTIRGLLAGKNVEQAYQLFEKESTNLEHYLGDRAVYDKLRGDVDAAYRELLDRQRTAAQYVREITSLVESREGEKAYDLFQKVGAELKRYADAKTFQALDAAVVKAKRDYEKGRQAAISTSASIRALLSQQKVQEAFESFKSAQADLRHYLDEKSYAGLDSDIQAAYRALLAKRKWATQQVRNINWALWRKQVQDAYAQFERYKGELQGCLDEASYTGLESAVTRALAEYRQQKDDAEAAAVSVRKLLAAKRIKEAYATFDEAEGDLKRFLSEADFKQLEKEVGAVYGALQEKERQILERVRAINTLVRQGKGEEAYAMFAKDSDELKKYLDAETYRQLGRNVTEAKRQHERNVARAAKQGQKIRTMVARDSLDAAYTALQSQRFFLKQYLDTQSYVSIEKAVETPYKELQQKRQETRELAAAVYKLLKHNEITGAHRTFYEFRPQLRQYLPQDEYVKLNKVVDKAYDDYIRNSKVARNVATRLNGLLRDGLVDSAYAGFKKTRTSLKRYLDAHTYSKLEDSVLGAYARLSEKRKTAKAYAKNVYARLRKGEVWPAYRDFRSKRTWLRTYLEKQAFEDLEKKVTTAYREARKGKGRK